MNRKLYVVALITVIGGIAAGVTILVTRPGNETVRIAAAQRNAAAQIYVALDKGFFREENITLDLIEPPTAAIGVRALIENDVDVALAPQMPVIYAALANEPILVLASLDRTERRVGLMVGKTVEGAKDLKGLKVGVTLGTNGELLLRRFLRDAGMAITDVEVVDLSPILISQALTEGAIDATASFEPFLTQAATKLPGSHILHSEGSFFDVWMLLVSPVFAHRRPDVARRMLKALVSATAYIHSHPDESRAIAARHQASPDPDWDYSSFRLRLFDSLPNSLAADAGIIVQIPEDIPDFRKFLYPALLRSVAPSSVSLSQ